MKKHIIIIILVILLCMIVSSFAFQVQADALGLGELEQYKKPDGDNDKVIDIGNMVVGSIRIVGSSMSITMLSIIGVKYLFGSIEQKAEYKQTMWPYVVGALLTFASSNVTSIIYKIFN